VSAMDDTTGQSGEAVLREPPLAGSELDTLIGGLERQRATLAWKCGGLDAAGMRATLGPSKITLGGLLKHLAHVEATYFRWSLLGESPGAPWETVDWDTDDDWAWRTAAEDTPEQLMALWQDMVAGSRDALARARVAGGAEQLGMFKTSTGESPSLRNILVTLVEEYARHVGHADLLRESIDGLVGEDPPR
jgi:hypothetical protein